MSGGAPQLAAVLPASLRIAEGMPMVKGWYVIGEIECPALMQHPVRLLLDPATQCIVFAADCGCEVKIDIGMALLKLAGQQMQAHPPASDTPAPTSLH